MRDDYQGMLMRVAKEGGSIHTDPLQGILTIDTREGTAVFAMKESMTGDNVVKIIDGKPPDSPH
ncbi:MULTISPECIES: hypothetical protein [Paenibacillus]|uniref:Uncharacterized protein n=1 Tax=Paenibacillus polymyxa TaxID=1406 RepID=A0ABX2ZBH9_PAEPO|nr:hypothetical protein [Paenibacillus polymyxa]ODA08451.1 hypothetical protein A7312_03300 [Paenibacillus polymyxa]